MIAPEQITHQDELTVEEPNPYRRRQKVIKIRRGEGVQSRLVKFLLVGILLPLALVAAGYGAVRWVLSSPLFYLQPEKDVRLSGNRIISTADVLSALALGNSANGRPVSLFRLDLDAMRRRVESVPWVASATITRVFPHRLDVSVVERTPVAFADVGGRVELVDKSGVLLELVEKAPLDYPVLYGLGSGRDLAQRRAMLGQYEQFLSDTSEAALGSGWTISEVDLSDPADLRVLLVQGRETV
ncbi:MAG: cell division protein FtsQ/DivIB, partial [Acetobacteraceae bacterium]